MACRSPRHHTPVRTAHAWLKYFSSETDQYENKDFERNDLFISEMEHFIDCVITGKPCLTDANHAKKVVKILEMGSLKK